jgi:hypothetical protein
MKGSCYHCGTQFETTRPLGRSDTCESCDRDLRVCRNCRFYSPGSHWDCSESIPEAVRDKERANFCDYFSPKPPKSGDGAGGRQADSSARAAFDSLFSDDG